MARMMTIRRMTEAGKLADAPLDFIIYLASEASGQSDIPDDNLPGLVIQLAGKDQLVALLNLYESCHWVQRDGDEEYLTLARRWVGSLPDQPLVLSLGEESYFAFDVDKPVIWLVPAYVECECEEDFVHLRRVEAEGECDVCSECGTLFCEMPDARMESVIEAGLPYNRDSLEFAGYA